jgi:hypothetical protein
MVFGRFRAYDTQKNIGPVVELRSHLPIDQQVRAMGATWLDMHLVGVGSTLAAQGFGAQVRDAIRDRVDYLASHGLAQWRGQRAVLASNLLHTLRHRDLAAAAKVLEEQTGHTYHAMHDGMRATGICRGSVQLASGKFTVLDDGRSFSLVPWQPVVEQRIGKRMTAVVHGPFASWQFGKQNGIYLCAKRSTGRSPERPPGPRLGRVCTGAPKSPGRPYAAGSEHHPKPSTQLALAAAASAREPQPPQNHP